MILVVGATGMLGGTIVRRLLAEGEKVRVSVRSRGRAGDLGERGAEVVVGDLRDYDSMIFACDKADRVVVTAHGCGGRGNDAPREVDGRGIRNLVHAALQADVEHMVLTSVLGARPEHPVEWVRMRYMAEKHLVMSGIPYTVVRHGPLMERWVDAVGRPAFENGACRIIGHGDNPVSLVSVDDVASYVLLGLKDERARDRIIDVAGPDELTLNELARMFADAGGRNPRISHLPLPLARLASVLYRPIDPGHSRELESGTLLESTDQVSDMTHTFDEFPLHLTHLGDVIHRDFVQRQA
jgi:uncharacterized protein YbjT (DUF2867 family)